VEQLSPEEKSRSGSSPGGHEKREVYSRREWHDCDGGLVPVDVAAIAFAAVDADDDETVEAAVVGTDGRQAVVAILRGPWSLPL